MPKRRAVAVDLAVGAVIAAAVGALGASRGDEPFRWLCDGAFVAAVMLLGVGGLRLAANKGTFDVAGFGAKVAVDTALPFLQHKKETILEYKERKAQARKSPAPLLIAGGCWLALSLVFLALYTYA